VIFIKKKKVGWDEAEEGRRTRGERVAKE